MNGSSTGSHDKLIGYRIRVRGQLGPGWAAWFDGLRVTSDGDGTTVIHGPPADQAALRGVLQKVRDLGVPLLAVTLETDQPVAPTTEPR